MKLTLISSSLEVGGTERVMSLLANFWAERGWKVTILTLDPGYAEPFYDLDRRIDLLPLGISGHDRGIVDTITNNFQRIQILRKAIKNSKPDVTISFGSKVNILSVLACWGLKVRTIVTEQVYPTFSGLDKFWQFWQKWTYRHADLVTVQTHSALSLFPSGRGFNTAVIPNPISLPESEAIESRLYTDDRHLLAVGKLTHQKGFDLLIRAFAQVKSRHPEWTLTILGEGNMRQELESLCTQLNLEDFVSMPGAVKNVDAYLRKADIFALTSRYEGFPVSLGEAMACGVPVIATDCLSGPREMIHDGKDGILVVPENVDALAVALDLLMSDPGKRQYFSHYAPRILDRFGVDRVTTMWNIAIKQVLEG
jgi:GalNAc-alpha-(1->4)-GalNAc-alpha-(1->3)-diNAcBac-PP-undecaprenol alpha-1,4-N-acetyl-D-galactosaminyltransferase